MSNRITPHFQPYVPPQQPASPASEPSAPKAPAEQQAAAPEGKPAASEMQGLSQPEQQMIQRYFPEKPDLSMRIYGADRRSQSVDPGAVGRHIDVQG